jgi:MFS family permease
VNGAAKSSKAGAQDEKRYRRNFWAMVGDSSFFSVGINFFEMSTVLPVFIASFTSSPLLIGSPVAIKAAGLYLPQLPLAMALRGRRRIKGFLVLQALIGRAALAATVPIALLAGGVHGEWVVGLFLLAYAIFSFTEGAATLSWLDLIGKAISSRVRGRFFGLVQAVGGVMSIAAGATVLWILAAEWLGPSDRFATLFALGVVFFFASLFCITLVHEPDEKVAAVESATALEQLRGLLDERLRRVMIAQVLVGSFQIALPFYAVYGQQRLLLSAEWVGLFIIAQTLGTAGAGLIWGRIVERRGPRAVLRIVALLVIATPPLAMAAGVAPVPSVAVLGLVFVLLGAATGGSRMGLWNYVLEMAQPHDRRLYFGVVNTANSPTLLMPIVGGALVQWGSYEVLFVASAAAGVAALAACLSLVEPHRLRAPAAAPRADGAQEA